MKQARISVSMLRQRCAVRARSFDFSKDGMIHKNVIKFLVEGRDEK